ncbi:MULTISPECIES: RNA polymerase sigma factor [unclassified Aureispira]|uniref:RNA polymerase sigma factor n=1 Tax=unclassified Aureispira TaxID=2649989 RepID=UPI00069752AD|nr:MULTISPECIES: sigma-70 family RNA polymerase sigma factor [unclassified Aureispira]WMX14336.1 sigma-70 family RNA polymerase sigma factor [Aureispira sp. CCB-E]
MSTSKYTVTQQAMEDEWLEVQAAQQNPAKFRVLYNRYYEPIFRFVYKRTVDEVLAADLTSQVFLKAMQKIDKYVFKGVPFSAWLFRIASNEIAQHFRKQNKNRVVALEERTAQDLEEEYEDKEDLEINITVLKTVIQDLKPDEVELLELRFFEKRPFKEVADILDITENNAKVKIYRLLQKMKKRFVKQKRSD